MQFLFVGANVCRQLPSDSTSQWTPLLLANDSYYNAHSGLAPIAYNHAWRTIKNAEHQFCSAFLPWCKIMPTSNVYTRHCL